MSHTPSAAPPAAVQHSRLWQQQRQPALQRKKAKQLPGVPSAAFTAQYAAPAAASLWCGASTLPGVPLPAGALMDSSLSRGSWGSSSGSSGTDSHSRSGGGNSVLGSAGGRYNTSSSHTRSKGGGSKGGRQPLDPTVRFYLTGLLVIAAVNSVITLIRAFSFAKGGLVAAQVCTAGGRVFTSMLCQRCWETDPLSVGPACPSSCAQLPHVIQPLDRNQLNVTRHHLCRGCTSGCWLRCWAYRWRSSMPRPPGASSTASPQTQVWAVGLGRLIGEWPLVGGRRVLACPP